MRTFPKKQGKKIYLLIHDTNTWPCIFFFRYLEWVNQKLDIFFRFFFPKRLRRVAAHRYFLVWGQREAWGGENAHVCQLILLLLPSQNNTNYNASMAPMIVQIYFFRRLEVGQYFVPFKNSQATRRVRFRFCWKYLLFEIAFVGEVTLLRMKIDIIYAHTIMVQWYLVCRKETT